MSTLSSEPQTKGFIGEQEEEEQVAELVRPRSTPPVRYQGKDGVRFTVNTSIGGRANGPRYYILLSSVLQECH